LAGGFGSFKILSTSSTTEEGAVLDTDDVYVVYRDERREWEAVLPALRELREQKGRRYLAEPSGLSERALRYALNGGKVPRRGARRRLAALLAEACLGQGLCPSES